MTGDTFFAMFYNFCRIHKTLRVTPAMAAGVSDRLWEWTHYPKVCGLVQPSEKAVVS
jgi:hypothetical protein